MKNGSPHELLNLFGWLAPIIILGGVLALCNHDVGYFEGLVLVVPVRLNHKFWIVSDANVVLVLFVVVIYFKVLLWAALSQRQICLRDQPVILDLCWLEFEERIVHDVNLRVLEADGQDERWHVLIHMDIAYLGQVVAENTLGNWFFCPGGYVYCVVGYYNYKHWDSSKSHEGAEVRLESGGILWKLEPWLVSEHVQFFD